MREVQILLQDVSTKIPATGPISKSSRVAPTVADEHPDVKYRPGCQTTSEVHPNSQSHAGHAAPASENVWRCGLAGERGEGGPEGELFGAVESLEV
ncbi:hypothetical protein G7Y89_g4487 [Cudoniella acicularis]|uniref:Uncharacterized protein n=1 Tax=Cudoniella acicularis TaxID=354080 RepID=A0A8H4RRH4_9HELO|nr:hypothetical protein G7Y89_g4487 [Cudoniella acicularis]